MNPDYSLRAFEAYLSGAENSEVNSDATWRNLKSTGLLLSTYVTEEESACMNSVNPDILIERHLEASNTEMSEGTKQTYKSRFNSAVGRFVKHQNDLVGQPTPLHDVIRNRQLRGFAESTKIQARQNKIREALAALPQPNFAGRASGQTFDAPFMLRPETGLTVKITGIPLDLTDEEAERIALFLKVYVRPR